MQIPSATSARGNAEEMLACAQPGSEHMAVRIIESADVADTATIGDGSIVWHLAQVRESASLGRHCVIGRGAYIGTAVEMGDNCKVQNYALVYEPARLAAGVFIGPTAVLTNDQYPRAINSDGSPKSASEWEVVGVTVGEGASIGARAVCVAPVTIGAWAMVAAGSTVVRDVPSQALVAGAPARHIGWVGRDGRRLANAKDDIWVSPTTGESYTECDGTLVAMETPHRPEPAPTGEPRE